MIEFFLEVIYIYIYRRIRDLREDNDKTQQQIADLLNTGLTTYRRWETGEREIPFHIVIELAKYYNVSIDYIAGLTKQPIVNWKIKEKIKNNITNNGNINGDINMN